MHGCKAFISGSPDRPAVVQAPIQGLAQDPLALRGAPSTVKPITTSGERGHSDGTPQSTPLRPGTADLLPMVGFTAIVGTCGKTFWLPSERPPPQVTSGVETKDALHTLS